MPDITTVGGLLELLADYDPGQPLLLAVQPNYPLAYRVAGATGPPPAACKCSYFEHPAPLYPDSDDHHPERHAASPAEGELPTVWLLQGEHTERPYDVPENLWASDGEAKEREVRGVWPQGRPGRHPPSTLAALPSPVHRTGRQVSLPNVPDHEGCGALAQPAACRHLSGRLGHQVHAGRGHLRRLRRAVDGGPRVRRC
jgi:hypothetical protein